MLANQLSQSSPSLWQQCLALIEEKVGGATFETWFRATDLSIADDNVARIQVPNRFFADFIEEHFSCLIKEVLNHFEQPCQTLVFSPIQKDWRIVEPIKESISQARNNSVPKSVERNGRFHPHYTFDAFVIGDNNRLAHAAALAVAEAPGKTTFNPLIFYGGTGLGKTHLLQAIGRFAQTEDTADQVVYLTSEEFTQQYINYVVEKKDSTSFYRQFSDVDLLLIDDIQFFSGKQGTQKEFFRIFNKLLLEEKQIVLSSDRPPDQIPDMMRHIISRFMGGLVADIQPPDLETRMAILRKKAESDGLLLTDDVIEYVAGHITSNVRELEGTLIKLIASSSFTGQDITLEIAKEVCGDAMVDRNQKISIQVIKQRVADIFGVTPNQLAAHTRKRETTLPRGVAMYLAKKWTTSSLRSIGLEFGGRDYSTVIHACNKIEAELKTDPALSSKIKQIEEVLGAVS